MSKFGKDLKETIEDVIAHKQGKLKLKTETFELPDNKDSKLEVAMHKL